MPPDSIDADPKSLPHSFRGYDRRATEELFRRVAWDYAVLAGEHRKLKENGDVSRPHTGAARANPDDEAHSLLAAAHRAARELRESTRAECEQALRKANRRSAEIELEAERTAKDARAVLAAAAELRASLREALTRLEGGELPVVPAEAAVAAPAADAVEST